MMARSTDRNPYTYNPSSVNVPVLSKTNRFTRPDTFTRGGEIQNIFFLFKRLIAKAVPAVIAAGKAGGTVIVIRSNDLTIMAHRTYPYWIIIGSVAKNPSNASIPMANMNLRLSA